MRGRLAQKRDKKKIGWLTNRNNWRKIGSKRVRERLAHKLQQFERDGSQSATAKGRLVHIPETDRA